MNIIMNEMNKIWKSKVTEEHIEKRLDKFLADIFPDKSRSYISKLIKDEFVLCNSCLLYTSPSPRDRTRSRMPSSA